MNEAFVIQSLALNDVDRTKYRKHSTFVSINYNCIVDCWENVAAALTSRPFPDVFISRIAYYSKFPLKIISFKGKLNTEPIPDWMNSKKTDFYIDFFLCSVHKRTVRSRNIVMHCNSPMILTHSFRRLATSKNNNVWNRERVTLGSMNLKDTYTIFKCEIWFGNGFTIAYVIFCLLFMV